jgi:hypothetical protein
MEELPATAMESADVTICDMDALPLVLGGEQSSATDGGAGSIIAIGTPKRDAAPDSVRWVDPRDFSILDDVLH